jgi:predicted metal-dependent phosphoesterase TrpH
MIDLHTHSTFSDGSLTPEELAAAARETGLSAIALTDHDTVDGTARLMAACEAEGITGVAGVEISADFPAGTMHLLGYFLDSEYTGLQEALAEVRGGRLVRNRKIVETLPGLGMEVAWDEVSALAGSDVIGRPHIAQAMVNRGYVPSCEIAFRDWLGKGKPAYADRFRLSPRDGIACIREAGGVAVLAHPFTLGLRTKRLRALISELVGWGLAGIEVFYPEHGSDRRQLYKGLAKEFDLVMTGGSDFHGAMNPAIQLGRGFGNVKVADSVLGDLRGRTGP